MTKLARWSIRGFAVLLVGVFVTVLALNALPAQSNDPAAGVSDPVTQITLDGDVILYDDILVPPAAAAAAQNLPRVGSYTELLRLLNSAGAVSNVTWTANEDTVQFGDKTMMEFDAATPMPSAAPVPPAMAAEGAAMDSGRSSLTGNVSSTNTQVSGVDEGDILKTDGQYLYILQENRMVRIVEADGANMNKIGFIVSNDDGYYTEMYVAGDRLILVGSRYEQQDASGDKMQTYIWHPSKSFTTYAVYDITDRANPVRTRLFEVEGSPLATRLVGDILYFAVNKYVYSANFDDNLTPGDIVPTVLDSVVSVTAEPMPVTDICYFPGTMEASYLIAGGFDINSDEPCAMETLLGAGSYFYMNADSMYIVKPEWTNDKNQSTVYRYALDGASLSFVGSGAVPGTPLNQYSMDEYEGVFRIATTDWSAGNYVTTMDAATLAVLGSTPALAQGESIQSVRYMGSLAYVVTYRQTDPLFAIDLSNPNNPTVLGELKIPGFSQYLHPVGDGLLVGFGRHTLETFVRLDDGTEQSVGTWDAGIKVSLFDVSDPTNPREVDKILLGNGSYSEAFDNPRAMLVDAAKSQFAFPIQVYSWDVFSGKESGDNWQGAVVIGVEGNALTTKAQLVSQDQNSYQRRLCYIGDTLYMIDNSMIKAFDYNTFFETGHLSVG